MDLTKKSAGMLMGVGNTLATLPTFVSPLITARILESSAGWTGVFVMIVVCNIIAVGVYARLAEPKNLDQSKIKQG